jgi:hypothetical protein
MMRSASLACLLALAVLTISVASHAQVAVGISVRVGPPPLPVYVQPVCPGPGYIWTPGYWAYGPDGYYWVPGTWVEPPEVGLLWTPGYWGWRDGFYVWNAGYWGPHVGFYGGINYGFGYTGVGFAGGYWRDRVFYYNRSVTNVNVVNIHNTYNTTVINNTTINRVSYNGGAGGARAMPTAAERNAAQEHHFQPTTGQIQHHQAAGSNRELLASVNHGSPAIAASPRPGVFKGQGVVAANRNNNFNRAATNHSMAPRSENKNSFQGRGPDTFKGRGPSNAASGPDAFQRRGPNSATNGPDAFQRRGPNSATNGSDAFRGSRQNNAAKGNASMYRTNQTYAGNPNVTRGNPHANAPHAQAGNGGQHENNSQGKEKHNRN